MSLPLLSRVLLLLLSYCGLLISKYQLDFAQTHFQLWSESDWFMVSAEEIGVKKEYQEKS